LSKPAVTVLDAMVLVAVIVGIDLLFFREKTWTWERLSANVGIVVVVGALYFRFVGRS
jgi:hypothetical protein